MRCGEEIPLVKRMAEKNRDKELTIIWIGFQDREDKIRKYAEKHNLRPVGYDIGDNVSKMFGIRYGAGLVFIDREGTVKSRIPKGISPARLETELKKILY